MCDHTSPEPSIAFSSAEWMLEAVTAKSMQPATETGNLTSPATVEPLNSYPNSLPIKRGRGRPRKDDPIYSSKRRMYPKDTSLRAKKAGTSSLARDLLRRAEQMLMEHPATPPHFKRNIKKFLLNCQRRQWNRYSL